MCVGENSLLISQHHCRDFHDTYELSPKGRRCLVVNTRVGVCHLTRSHRRVSDAPRMFALLCMNSPACGAISVRFAVTWGRVRGRQECVYGLCSVRAIKQVTFPSCTDNYLCSRALQREQRRLQKAPHSMWRHKAKGNRVHGSGWPVRRRRSFLSPYLIYLISYATATSSRLPGVYRELVAIKNKSISVITPKNGILKFSTDARVAVKVLPFWQKIK